MLLFGNRKALLFIVAATGEKDAQAQAKGCPRLLLLLLPLSHLPTDSLTKGTNRMQGRPK